MTQIEAGADEGIEGWLEAGKQWCQEELTHWLDGLSDAPPTLVEAMRHALLAGGKRLRPSLVRLFCGLAGGDPELASGPAIAIEMVHTYSLIHDDLPCMDDDDVRRGLPTVHRKWGDATAVLAGDALLTEAFGVLGPEDHAGAMTATLAAAAGASGMVGGQLMDLSVELIAIQESDRLQAVESIHRSKTAALFGAACELGWIAGGGADSCRTDSSSYGVALGLLFQATDDVIDVTGTATGLGKTPGKDAALDRPTAVAALGLSGAKDRAEHHAGIAKAAALRLHAPEGSPAYGLIDQILARTH